MEVKTNGPKKDNLTFAHFPRKSSRSKRIERVFRNYKKLMIIRNNDSMKERKADRAKEAGNQKRIIRNFKKSEENKTEIRERYHNNVHVERGQIYEKSKE